MLDAGHTAVEGGGPRKINKQLITFSIAVNDKMVSSEMTFDVRSKKRAVRNGKTWDEQCIVTFACYFPFPLDPHTPTPSQLASELCGSIRHTQHRPVCNPTVPLTGSAAY